MAMSKTTNTYNRQNWEDAVSISIKIYKWSSNNFLYILTFQEFPILCQTCLGDNPYIRMVSYFII